MEKKNKVIVTLSLTEVGLKRFKNILTFKQLLHPEQLKVLQVGDNTLTVNHTVLGTLTRMSDEHITLKFIK